MRNRYKRFTIFVNPPQWPASGIRAQKGVMPYTWIYITMSSDQGVIPKGSVNLTAPYSPIKVERSDTHGSFKGGDSPLSSWTKRQSNTCLVF